MAHGRSTSMESRDVVFCILITAFLYSGFGETLSKLLPQPEFLAPLENHTVIQGRDVSFTCVVNHLQSYKVVWIKSDSRAILAIHTHMIAHNPRLFVTHNGHNTWKLHVTNVQRSDSGTYMCQVNTDPMKSQMGYMTVVIPPDIMDLDEDSVDDMNTKEGGDVVLKCITTGIPEPDVTWRREDGRDIVLREEHSSTKRVKIFEGEELQLVGVLRQEMGSYLCIASNGVPPSVSKRYFVHVRFEPLVRVASQLVAAPGNSDVILQCYVESSPQALNTWYKNNGIKLLPDNKYRMSETPVNIYSYQLNLTIRNLELSDFGSYTCSSENAYGKAEGTIRLQELHLTKSSVATTRSMEIPDKTRKKTVSPEKKKKYSYSSNLDFGKDRKDYTTPMSWENLAKGLRSTNDSSALSKFSSGSNAPRAPESAHLAPTQQDIPKNEGRVLYAYRHLILNCVILMLQLFVQGHSIY
ncbi:lachesin [Cephus cinctus]|uniref:Lachesin n=1 Tax=Cephus cinctus TaxID=211228 RepID=A0AAJ7RQW1_CEPCN|nr:lachesin [Cephus cinctus]XP_024944787.1 lachesin [Cephus cinctus]XP_024944788.1 lachesin [Cephus cinctus]XP_024944789.1 lachesin [Cephus cinctus]XP_024944790.1 lachesin [Cephus cinctus]XP_024944791.1 lachesin [Cephus cinctus]